mgnify:CR=1 FL=1
MSALAYIQTLQPLYWGVAVIRAISKWGQSREAIARLYNAAAATPSSFNRLEKEFVRQTIKVSEIIHPTGEGVSGKTFIECEFHGPGLILMSGCTFDEYYGGNVEFIRLRGPKGQTIPNKAYLFNCHLKDCRFYNVAIALTTETVDAFKAINPKMLVLGE